MTVCTFIWYRRVIPTPTLITTTTTSRTMQASSAYSVHFSVTTRTIDESPPLPASLPVVKALWYLALSRQKHFGYVDYIIIARRRKRESTTVTDGRNSSPELMSFVWQNAPVYPFGHVQVNVVALCITHVPALRHGNEAHRSICVWHIEPANPSGQAQLYPLT